MFRIQQDEYEQENNANEVDQSNNIVPINPNEAQIGNEQTPFDGGHIDNLYVDNIHVDERVIVNNNEPIDMLNQSTLHGWRLQPWTDGSSYSFRFHTLQNNVLDTVPIFELAGYEARFSQRIVPRVDIQTDLGINTHRFRNAYVNTVLCEEVHADSFNVGNSILPVVGGDGNIGSLETPWTHAYLTNIYSGSSSSVIGSANDPFSVGYIDVLIGDITFTHHLYTNSTGSDIGGTDYPFHGLHIDEIYLGTSIIPVVAATLGSVAKPFTQGYFDDISVASTLYAPSVVSTTVRPSTANTGSVGTSIFPYSDSYTNNVHAFNDFIVGPIDVPLQRALHMDFNHVFNELRFRAIDNVNSSEHLLMTVTNENGTGGIMTIGHVLPMANLQKNLGSITFMWNNGYISDIHTNQVNVGEIIIPLVANTGSVGTSSNPFSVSYVDDVHTNRVLPRGSSHTIGSVASPFTHGYFDAITVGTPVQHSSVVSNSFLPETDVGTIGTSSSRFFSADVNYVHSLALRVDPTGYLSFENSENNARYNFEVDDVKQCLKLLCRPHNESTYPLVEMYGGNDSETDVLHNMRRGVLANDSIGSVGDNAKLKLYADNKTEHFSIERSDGTPSMKFTYHPTNVASHELLHLGTDFNDSKRVLRAHGSLSVYDANNNPYIQLMNGNMSQEFTTNNNIPLGVDGFKIVMDGDTLRYEYYENGAWLKDAMKLSANHVSFGEDFNAEGGVGLSNNSPLKMYYGAGSPDEVGVGNHGWVIDHYANASGGGHSLKFKNMTDGTVIDTIFEMTNYEVRTTYRIVPMVNEGASLGTATKYFSQVHGQNMYANAFNTASDQRLKQDIDALPLTCSKHLVNSLQPKKYRYIQEGAEARKRCGFIAQDVRTIMDDSCYNTDADSFWYKIEKDDNDEPVENGMQGLNYMELLPHLVNYVKDLQAQITVLQQRVDDLSSQP